MRKPVFTLTRNNKNFEGDASAFLDLLHDKYMKVFGDCVNDNEVVFQVFDLAPDNYYFYAEVFWDDEDPEDEEGPDPDEPDHNDPYQPQHALNMPARTLADIE